VDSRTGLARRFNYYIAEDYGRDLDGTEADQEPDISPITELFQPLLNLEGGKLAWGPEALDRWKAYHAENSKELKAAPRNNAPLVARLKSAPSGVMKVAQIFEACRAAHHKLAAIKEISLQSLEPAISHIAECMKASAYMDTISDDAFEEDQADVILATIRKDFKGQAAEDGTIYLSKTDLTRRFCNHGRSRLFNTVTLYLKIIPQLQARGECVQVVKQERLEVYAFAPEVLPRDDGGNPVKSVDEDPNPPNPPIPPGGISQKTPEKDNKSGGIGGIVRPTYVEEAEGDQASGSDIPPGVIGGIGGIAQIKGEENEILKRAPAIEFRVVDKPEALNAALQEFSSTGLIALDIETYGDHPSHALDSALGDIRILSLALKGGAPVVFDLKAIGYNQPWNGVLAERQVIGHNLRFDAEWLVVKLGIRLSKMFCTYSAAKLLSNGDISLRNDLGAVLDRYLGVQIPKELGASDWGSWCLTDGQQAYAALDVIYLHKLASVLTREINSKGMRRVFDLEMRLLPVVIDMQACGMPVSKERLGSIIAGALLRSKQHEAELKAHLGGFINFDSPDQLKDAFTAIGLELPNTAEETLKTCSHPAAALLLDYREAEMERRQAESLLKEIGTDGRIHCQFKPLGTVTGRFSSADPNLQNISRGPMRSCFTPADPGKTLIVADYSQIELRVAAAIAEDRSMLLAFRAGKDLHRKTAAAVLMKRPEQVTKEDRQLAKAVNFGLLYGQGAEGLVRYARTNYGIILELTQAKLLRSAFFKHYPGLARWHKEAWEKAPKTTEGRTLLGRRRLVSGENITDWDRFQVLTNFRVQGTAADCLKLAMAKLAPLLQPHDAHLVATVHDELLIECPGLEAEIIRELCVSTMKSAALEILRNAVPIEVDAKICESWGDK
jgi:DNA polymerase I